MGVTMTGPGGERRDEIDWDDLKRRILEKLDVAAEYRALKLQFSASGPNTKGYMACHAIDREDENPSASVHIPTGKYHDFGSTRKPSSLFDFAADHGSFGHWMEAMRHYAEVAGVPWPLERIIRSSGGRIREAQFFYRDEADAIRYCVNRYILPNGKKTFTQHPPDGKGGWVLGSGCMDGIEPLPYRLPELLAADPAEDVLIVEGEKKVDRAMVEGFVATSSHGGCQATSRTWPVFLHHFRDRNCFILPDNDPGGREHARKVAGYLHGIARSVKVVELPDLPPSGDICDWLDAGGDVAELCQLCHDAPEWTPMSAPEPECPGSETVGDGDPRTEGLPASSESMLLCMADVVIKPVRWLWPSCFPLGKIAMLAGDAKLGKSFLVLDLAARVSAGLEIPNGGGECIPKGSVIFFSAEDDFSDTIVPRLIAAGADLSKIYTLPHVINDQGHKESFSLAHIPHLERRIADLGDVLLLVIDPVTAFHISGTDDYKATSLRAALDPLKEMAGRWGVATILLSHFTKGNGTKALGRVIGSQAYTALARVNWVVLKDAEDPNRRQFVCAGNNLCKPPAGLGFHIHEVESRIEWEPGYIYMDADEAMRRYAEQIERESQEAKQANEQPSKQAGAEAWLTTRFPTTPGVEIPSERIMTEGKQAGFTYKTLHSARKKLGIWARKTNGPKGIWLWYRPSSESDADLKPPREDDAWR